MWKRHQFRRALVAAPVAAGLITAGVTAAPATAAPTAVKVKATAASAPVKVGARTTADSKACTVTASVTWMNAPPGRAIRISLYQGTTILDWGTATNPGVPADGTISINDVAGTSGATYYTQGLVYDEATGTTIASATSRTVTLTCK